MLLKLRADSISSCPKKHSTTAKKLPGRHFTCSYVLISEDITHISECFYIFISNHIFCCTLSYIHMKKIKGNSVQPKHSFLKKLAAVFFDLLPGLCWPIYQVSSHNILITNSSVCCSEYYKLSHSLHLRLCICLINHLAEAVRVSSYVVTQIL